MALASPVSMAGAILTLFPGKFVPWMVLCSCLCQHVPAPFCNTLQTASRRAGKGLPTSLRTARRKRLRKWSSTKPQVGKGGRKQGFCMTQRLASHLSKLPPERRGGLSHPWPLVGGQSMYTWALGLRLGFFDVPGSTGHSL